MHHRDREAARTGFHFTYGKPAPRPRATFNALPWLKAAVIIGALLAASKIIF